MLRACAPILTSTAHDRDLAEELYALLAWRRVQASRPCPTPAGDDGSGPGDLCHVLADVSAMYRTQRLKKEVLHLGAQMEAMTAVLYSLTGSRAYRCRSVALLRLAPRVCASLLCRVLCLACILGAAGLLCSLVQIPGDAASAQTGFVLLVCLWCCISAYALGCRRTHLALAWTLLHTHSQLRTHSELAKLMPSLAVQCWMLDSTLLPVSIWTSSTVLANRYTQSMRLLQHLCDRVHLKLQGRAACPAAVVLQAHRRQILEWAKSTRAWLSAEQECTNGALGRRCHAADMLHLMLSQCLSKQDLPAYNSGVVDVDRQPVMCWEALLTGRLLQNKARKLLAHFCSDILECLRSPGLDDYL
jgi:hypothetical protein